MQAASRTGRLGLSRQGLAFSVFLSLLTDQRSPGRRQKAGHRQPDLVRRSCTKSWETWIGHKLSDAAAAPRRPSVDQCRTIARLHHKSQVGFLGTPRLHGAASTPLPTVGTVCPCSGPQRPVRWLSMQNTCPACGKHCLLALSPARSNSREGPGLSRHSNAAQLYVLCTSNISLLFAQCVIA